MIMPDHKASQDANDKVLDESCSEPPPRADAFCITTQGSGLALVPCAIVAILLISFSIWLCVRATSLWSV